jgi:hypothetical protein
VGTLCDSAFRPPHKTSFCHNQTGTTRYRGPYPGIFACFLFYAEIHVVILEKIAEKWLRPHTGVLDA